MDREINMWSGYSFNQQLTLSCEDYVNNIDNLQRKLQSEIIKTAQKYEHFVLNRKDWLRLFEIKGAAYRKLCWCRFPIKVKDEILFVFFAANLIPRSE